MDGAATEGRIFHKISALTLGALVGTLVGLSIHAVVGSTLTALLALLGGYFGLRGNEDASRFAAIRITLFSAACLAALLLSLYVRTHNLLSPRLEAELSDLKTRHIVTDQDVRSIILFKKYGLVPPGFTAPQQEGSSSDSILFSNADAWDCTHLQADLFPNPQARIDAMRSIGGAWAKLAEEVANVEPARQAELMQRGFEHRCAQ